MHALQCIHFKFIIDYDPNYSLVLQFTTLSSIHAIDKNVEYKIYTLQFITEGLSCRDLSSTSTFYICSQVYSYFVFSLLKVALQPIRLKELRMIDVKFGPESY